MLIGRACSRWLAGELCGRRLTCANLSTNIVSFSVLENLLKRQQDDGEERGLAVSAPNLKGVNAMNPFWSVNVATVNKLLKWVLQMQDMTGLVSY